MRCCTLSLSVLVFALIATGLAAPSPGIFRGVVIMGPDHEPGWIMVMGANGQMRRVGITRAQVVYDASIPVNSRQKKPELSIVHGAEVRVTAQQDGSGEWHATKVEILKLQADLPVRPSARSEDLRST